MKQKTTYLNMLVVLLGAAFLMATFMLSSCGQGAGGQLLSNSLTATGLHIPSKICITDQQPTEDELTHRSETGTVYVQTIQGTVLNAAGDGEDDEGYYIHYPDRFNKGDRVETMLIYNPMSNYVDDVVYRSDKVNK